jgi:predicted butyrate kinase (DUF1464 family)
LQQPFFGWTPVKLFGDYYDTIKEVFIKFPLKIKGVMRYENRQFIRSNAGKQYKAAVCKTDGRVTPGAAGRA